MLEHLLPVQPPYTLLTLTRRQPGPPILNLGLIGVFLVPVVGKDFVRNPFLDFADHH